MLGRTSDLVAQIVHRYIEQIAGTACRQGHYGWEVEPFPRILSDGQVVVIFHRRCIHCGQFMESICRSKVPREGG